MNTFEFVPAHSVAEAGELLTANEVTAKIVAGGTDLFGEIKQGIAQPAKLVSLQSITGLMGVSLGGDVARIGAMTTIAEIAENSQIRTRYAALAEAAESVATPQIRNTGTLGGNLCQRPRCWYYRSPLFDCRKKGGARCFAHDGANKFHAIIGGEVCPAVHPSDTAVALMALDAQVATESAGGARLLPMQDFFAAPEVDVTSENVLRPGEILTAVVIPPATANLRSVYLKAKERQAMDFALVSVALAVEVADDTIGSARIALGGVAPVPHRARNAESAMLSKTISDIDAERIGRLAVEGATPLTDNGYKVRLASSLVSRAVRILLSVDVEEPCRSEPH